MQFRQEARLIGVPMSLSKRYMFELVVALAEDWYAGSADLQTYSLWKSCGVRCKDSLKVMSIRPWNLPNPGPPRRIMSSWGGLGVHASSLSWNGLSSFRLWAHEICLLWKVDFWWSWSRTSEIFLCLTEGWKWTEIRGLRRVIWEIRCKISVTWTPTSPTSVRGARWSDYVEVPLRMCFFSAVACLFQWRVMSDFWRFQFSDVK